MVVNSDEGPRLGRRVTIAVIGPEDLVDRAMSVAAATTEGARLLGAPYQREDDTVQVVRSVHDETDVLLFTGPVPHDVALSAGVAQVPATYVSLNGEALYRALLATTLAPGTDLQRLSIDTLGDEEVDEVYRELELDRGHVHTRPYEKGEESRVVADWHTTRFEAGTTTAALTCRRSVYRTLQERGVPTWRVVPTRQSILATAKLAMLLGSGHRAERSRLALCLIEPERLLPSAGQATSVHVLHEMRLTLHRTLLDEALDLGGTVVSLVTGQFLVITTVGALQLATSGFAVAPFVDAVEHALGQRVSVGIGTASTAHDAEAAAYLALEAAQSDGGGLAYLRDDSGTLHRLAPRASGSELEPEHAQGAGPELESPAAEGRDREHLARLREALRDDTPAGRSPTVDAHTAAEVLDISLPSARRLLRSLAAEGLVWPVSSDTQSRGRPRNRYRLVPERRVQSHD